MTEKSSRSSETSSTMPSKISGVTSTPPWRSASVTTPTGNESQARMRLHGSASGPGAGPSSQAISVEPPPMSKTMTDCAFGIGERRAAGDGEIRFGAAIDDFEIEAKLLARPGR